MSNPTGNKLEKLVFGMFDQMIEGADKYATKQGSTWLIFTEDKRWAIEFTNDKTLWFNYNIFQSELELIGKDCTEERDLIKKWFESRFLNKPKVKEAHHVDVMKFFDKKMENTIENGVKDTKLNNRILDLKVEDTIQEGVKRTCDMEFRNQLSVEDTIQEGVKDIIDPFWVDPVRIKDVIQNGVKDTRSYSDRDKKTVGDIIQSGVKETYESKSTKSISLRHAIKNGVKHVEDGDWLDQDERIDDIIENGVKETKEISNISLMSEIFKVKAKQTIRDGVKELKELPDKSGEFRGYGDWYRTQGNMTKPHTEYVKEVIEDSYNHMGRVEGVIRNTDKDGI